MQGCASRKPSVIWLQKESTTWMRGAAWHFRKTYKSKIKRCCSLSSLTGPIAHPAIVIITGFASAGLRQLSVTTHEEDHGNCIAKLARGKGLDWHQGNSTGRLLRDPNVSRRRKLSHLRHEGPSHSDQGLWHGETGGRGSQQGAWPG